MIFYLDSATSENKETRGFGLGRIFYNGDDLFSVSPILLWVKLIKNINMDNGLF